ncbi:MAG: sulfite exporter TauE/SafE family protein, partial [Thermodesulfobacteriota bacterium]|nr:sulfite exporter TauE/SafE family protein [Thermodesulfobacteriota bacterium]
MIVIIAGFILGIIGAIIGSTLLVLVPMLNLLGLPIHVALGTAKFANLFREIIPLIQFRKNKLLNLKIIIPFTISGAIFSAIGTHIALILNEKILSILIGLFMIIISLIILLKPNLGLTEREVQFSTKTTVLSLIFGSLIGFYQGVFGGGTNVFIIFSFIFLFGNDFLKAVANSKSANFILLFPSSLIFLIKDYVNWPFALPLMISTVIGSYFGAKLAIKKGSRLVSILFIGLVIIMGIKLLL